MFVWILGAFWMHPQLCIVVFCIEYGVNSLVFNAVNSTLLALRIDVVGANGTFGLRAHRPFEQKQLCGEKSGMPMII